MQTAKKRSEFVGLAGRVKSSSILVTLGLTCRVKSSSIRLKLAIRLRVDRRTDFGVRGQTVIKPVSR